MLQFQNVPVLFTEGVDTKLDKYLKTANDALENATVSEKGTPSKRKGFDKSSNAVFFQGSALGDPITEINEMFSSRNRVGVSTDRGMVHANTAAQRFELSEQKSAQLAAVNLKLNYDTSTITNFDRTASAGVAKCSTFTAYVANKTIILVDLDGEIIAERVTAGIAKVISLDDRIFVANQVPSPSDSIFISEALIDGTFSSIGQLDDVDFTDLSTTKFDLASDGLKTIYMTAFKGTEARIMVKSFHIDTLATNYAEPLFFAGAPKKQIPAVAVDTAAERVVLTYIADDAGDIKSFAEILNLLLAPLLSNVVINDTGFGAISTPTPVSTSYSQDGVLFNAVSLNTGLRVSTYDLLLGSPITSGLETDIFIGSKPIKRGQYYYMAVRQVIELTYPFTLDHYLMAFDARAGFSLQSSVSSTIAKEIQDNDFTAQDYLPTSLDGYAVTNGDYGVFYDLSFDRSDYGSSLEVAGIGYTTGSFSYDGAQLKPIGFCKRPSILSHTATLAGNVPDGAYNYQVVLVRQNAQGEIERSAPSDTYNVTVSGGAKIVEFAVITTYQGYPFKIEVYRKLVADTVYRLAGESTFGFPTSVIDNTVSLSGQPTLYTTGGILENDTPPPFSSIVFHQGRIFGVNALKFSEIWFSKLKEVAVTVNFSAFNTIQLDENQGRTTERVTALASLDNKLIVFKERSIFVIFGDGPDNAGGGTAFSRPEMISSEVGCVDPRSICNTSKGVFFKSKKGIYLLSRGLEVVELGAPVYGFKDQKITSAVMMKDLQQVRFGTLNSDMLVYDYSYDQWSTFKNVESVAAVQVNSGYFVAQSDGFLIENEAYNDNGAFIQQRLTTGWLKVSGINGFQRAQRLKILGEYKSAHTMKVRVSYDYESYHWDEYTLSPATGYNITVKPALADYQNGTNNGVFEWELHLRRQKCEAMKVEIFDEEDGVQGASFDLTGMTIRVGLKQGMSKANDAKVR